MFIRYPRGGRKACRSRTQPRLLEIGKAQVVLEFLPQMEGRKVALFGLGPMNTIARQRRRINLRRKALDVRRHQSAFHQAD